ncbi:hypothetical protein PCANC_07316 [Puccinia coronata f. sp. avenae]|uniref:Uncharacterized protein n=1 Tax=Puccinia coronata f. sp. avenae TaxID=200324 RepID=A0A2N5T6H5_9BASI|nr:hypothetical protein PCANC_07316 [Puccinia coronata f. sp. avenae]
MSNTPKAIVTSNEPPLPLPSPAQQSPSGPIPKDHKDQDTKPISSNKETTSDRGPSDGNPTRGGSLQRWNCVANYQFR